MVVAYQPRRQSIWADASLGCQRQPRNRRREGVAGRKHSGVATIGSVKVNRAPAQIETPFRELVRRELGWDKG